MEKMEWEVSKFVCHLTERLNKEGWDGQAM